MATLVEKELLGEQKVETLGLTHVLVAYSRKRVGMFGEARGRSVTIFSHVVIGFVCATLALFYFSVLPIAQLRNCVEPEHTRIVA